MWKLVSRWCDIPLFQASSWDSFNDWIISWHASKEKKHRFYVITTSVLWWLWRYRNSVTFNSQPLRKSDLFDNVRFSSFSWLHNRDHMKLSWNDWLMNCFCLFEMMADGEAEIFIIILKIRKCPCFTAGLECDPNVCRNCLMSIQDLLLLKRIEEDGDGCRANVGSDCLDQLREDLCVNLGEQKGVGSEVGCRRNACIARSSTVENQNAIDACIVGMHPDLAEVRVHMLKFSFFVNCT
ncbi:hypothetical protein Tco_0304928 [Tanacetum coccineum]